MICSKCGRNNPENSAFCEACGTPLQSNPSPAPGYQNAGYQNAGYPNQGYPNPGYQNPGYQNAGYQTPGYQNPGYQNAAPNPYNPYGGASAFNPTVQSYISQASTILTLSILGLVFVGGIGFIFLIIAAVKYKGLPVISDYPVDPLQAISYESAKRKANAAKTCTIIGFALIGVFILFLILYFLFFATLLSNYF